MTLKLTILFFACTVYFFSYFQRVAIPGTIFNQLQTEFGVSASAVAALSATFLYIYGGMQFFAGVMADRFGGGRTLVAGGALLTAGSLLFPLAGSMGGLYAGRIVIALGAGMVYLSLLKVIDDSFEPKKFPLLLSLAVVLGFTGGLAGTLPFERAANAIGWRGALLGAAAFCGLAVTAAAILLGKMGAPRTRPSAFRPDRLVAIMKNRRAWPVFAAGPINFSIYFLFQAVIGKKMLEDCAGVSSPRAATVTFMMMIVTQAWLLFQGFISQRCTKRRPFLVFSVSCTTAGLTIVSLALLAASPPAAWMTAGYLLAAIGGGNVLVVTLIKEMNPPEAAATATGFYNGLVYLVVALSGNLSGLALDIFRGQAVTTAEAVIYPAAAYRLLCFACLALSLFSLAAASRIREIEPAPRGHRPPAPS